MRRKMLLIAMAVCLCLGLTGGLDNGLARTPPMGWLSWERFRCETDCTAFPDSCINEDLYKAMADKMVSDGYKDAGYEYVNIDDCWLANERDPHTMQLMPDPDRFPSGIKALADYMHSRGLKLGIYEDFGVKTCAGYPGSEFFMELDAQTFASWEVDMVKFDGCNSDPADSSHGYPVMQMYLNRTGRSILFSCEWPLYEYGRGLKSDYAAIRKTCNMWRNYGDVTDAWSSVTDIMKYYAGNAQNFTFYTGPGGWADPDMLVVGDFGLSIYQQKAQFGMWAMFAAPLFMSNDLRRITPEARAILLNRNAIAINQDPLGASATNLYYVVNSWSVWLKPLSGKAGTYAIAFLNEDNNGRASQLKTTLGDLGLNNSNGYNVTEVFDNKPMGMFKLNSPFEVLVDPTSILLVKAVPM